MGISKMDLNAKDIIEKYISEKLSLKEIGDFYKVNRSVIKKILLKNNIVLRKFTNKTQKNINLDFFNTESDELYYFWGFILGDGSLMGSGLTISLNHNDNSILKMFCKWLNIQDDNIKYYKSSTRKDGDICKLIIYYKNNNFIKYGICERKTYNPIIPDIPEKYIRPFLLGLLDADGHITFSKKENYNICIVGNLTLMDWYETQIRLLGFKGDIKHQTSKNNNWKRIRVRRKQDVIDLAKILEIKKYEKIVLNRKWKNIIDFLDGKNKVMEPILTSKKIIEIKKLIDEGNILQKEIAKIYNICIQSVIKIKKGIVWNYI